MPATWTARVSSRPRLPRGLVLRASSASAAAAAAASGAGIDCNSRSSSGVTQLLHAGQLDGPPSDREPGTVCASDPDAVDLAQHVPVGPSELARGDDAESDLVRDDDGR